jgi:hypothetical protein
MTSGTPCELGVREVGVTLAIEGDWPLKEVKCIGNLGPVLAELERIAALRNP